MKCHILVGVLSICCGYFAGVSSHKEEECVEVGFARASFLTVEQGYQAAKEELLVTWKEEDETRLPSYANLPPQLKNVTRSSSLLELATKKILALIRKTRVGKRCPEEWLLKGIEKHVTPLIQLDKELAEGLGLVMSFRCLVGSPYPNVDGTCINEEGPDMGSMGSKFLRLIPPDTGKGGFSLRTSVKQDKTLPSARQVAQLIRRHMVKPAMTSLFTEFSHFVALDSISIPASPSVENMNCCATPDHVDCAPIILDESDPLFRTIKCFNYKRSIPAQAILGHRESLSLVSTYLDATSTYGATNQDAFSLKEGYFGYLKYPPSMDEDVSESEKKSRKKNCRFPKSFKGCFGLGSNENNFLENMRLLFVLEHNFIADTLAELNPHFDDSLLYNEARRILIGEYNAILFGEFVPLLVGKELSEKHTLLPGSEGPGAKFIPQVNPGILTSHALASYRNPAMIDEWKSEWGKTDILTAHHYESIREDPYQDFLAMDIQRGRDHGLVNYGAWRGFCDSGNYIPSWEEMEKVFSKEIVEDLRKLYQDELADLDMLIALLETPEEGSIVGKIFTCILVDQYARLRTGNRLYWEHDSSMLTHEQRDAIRSQSSASALLCRHFDLKKVATNPFKDVSESNPELSCDTFALKLDLSPWKDTSLIEVMKKKKEEEELKRKEEEELKRKEEGDLKKKGEKKLEKKEEEHQKKKKESEKEKEEPKQSEKKKDKDNKLMNDEKKNVYSKKEKKEEEQKREREKEEREKRNEKREKSEL